MARIQRRRRSMIRHRRSREERRRLSEGGGSTRHPPPTTEGPPNPGFVPQVEMQKLTEKETETAYLTVFHFDEYDNIVLEESFYEDELENLLATKSYVDDKISKLKLTTKAPDSDNIKLIRSFTRKSLELQESIDVANRQLHEMCLTKTELEAHYRSSLSIINQHVAKEDPEGDMLLGYLAYVLMME